MVKARFLSDLKEDQLKEIAKEEGLAIIPKNYHREDYIKFLEGVLTREKARQYKNEYVEREIERDIHIHETIKEKSSKEEGNELTKTTLTKHEVIFNLQKERINKNIYEPIADFLHEPIPTGSGVKLYDKMGEKMRRYVHSVFVEGESDRTGHNFEFRSANWLLYNVKDIVRIETRHKFPGIGEIDIIGYDKYDLPYVIAECKDRGVSFEDIDKWQANSKSVIEEFSSKIRNRYREIEMKSYFFSSAGYSQGVVERVKNNSDIDKNGWLNINKGFLKDNFHIKMHVYDVRNGKYIRLYP